MMDLIYRVATTFLFSGLFIAFFILLYVVLDNGLTLTKKKWIELTIVLAMCYAILFNLIPRSIFSIILFMFIFLILLFSFNLKKKKLLKSICVAFCIMLITDVVMLLILSSLFKIDVVNIQQNLVNFIYYMPIKFLYILVAIIIQRRVKKNGSILFLRRTKEEHKEGQEIIKN